MNRYRDKIYYLYVQIGILYDDMNDDVIIF